MGLLNTAIPTRDFPAGPLCQRFLMDKTYPERPTAWV